MMKKTNAKTILRIVLLAIGVLGGLFSPYFNIIVLLLAIVFIFQSNRQEILEISSFLLPFAPILKIDITGFSLFNIVIMFSVLRLLLLNRKITINIILFVFLFAYSLMIDMLKSYLSVLSVMAYLLFALLVFVPKELDCRKIVRITSAGVIIASVLALMHNYIPRINAVLRVARIKFSDGSYYYRFSGLDGNPNFYTVILSVLIAAIVVLIVENKSKLIDYFFLSALVVFGLLSASNSFYVTLALILALYILSFGYKKNRILSFLGIIIGLTAIIFTIDESVLDVLFYRINKIRGADSLDIITTGRASTWQFYADYLINNPVEMFFGRGLGAEDLSVGASHSYYLEIVYYYGIIGGMLYCAFLLSIFYRSRKKYKRVLVRYSPLIVFLVRAFARNLISNEQLVFLLMICFMCLYTSSDEKTRGSSSAVPEAMRQLPVAEDLSYGGSALISGRPGF